MNQQRNETSFLIFEEKNMPDQKIHSTKQFMYLQLFDQPINLYYLIPRFFTISTRNASYGFNVEMLKDTSSVISNLIDNDAEQNHYFFDIEDDENIVGKFEQLYLGKNVVFNESDLPIACFITKELNITNIPYFLKQDVQRLQYYRITKPNAIHLSRMSFEDFLKQKIPKSFLIITNNKEYKCNKYGVYSSKIIYKAIMNDPTTSQFVYDFDNEFNEFQQICDFFNFESVQITSINMNSLKRIAEDLNIECILNDINNFIHSYENSTKTIDAKHEIIDDLNELFHLLYHIKENKIENVKAKIIESSFSYGEDNVQELAACILQVIHTDSKSHPYLIDLLQILNEEANETNNLNILLPFVIKQLMISFAKNKLNCSFVYLLYKKGLISINEIVDKIVSEDKYLTEKVLRYDLIEISDKLFHNNSIVWFFPELIEIKKISKESILMNLDDELLNFIRKYLPDNIEKFKKMRDNGEPDDEITKCLIHDDIDSFQSIIIANKIDVTQNLNKIPFNIFETFFIKDYANYLNYSAAHGSIKCLKYLLLNHAPIDRSTICFAVYGGNSEIIHIIDQNSEKQNEGTIDDNTNIYYQYDINDIFDDKLYLNSIYPSAFFAIQKHQNKIFDWILDQKFISKCITGNLLSNLALMSAQNGNIYTLIKCIDIGLDLSSPSRYFCEKIIQISAEKGFLRFTEFLLNLMNEKSKHFIRNYECSVSFGNLSIFKLFRSIWNEHYDYEKPLLISIERNYINIVNFIVEKVFEEKILLSRGGIMRILCLSIKKNSADLFLYFIEKFKLDNLMKKFNISITDFYNFLLDGCKAGNFEAVKVITNLIIQKNPKVDFTEPFIRAVVSGSFEICNFFVEKKTFLNFLQLSKESSRLTQCDERILDLLLKITEPDIKETFINSFLYDAIENGNQTLVKFLLKSKVSYDCALFEAVKHHNIDIVNLILEHNSDPSFVNNVSYNGTALNIAVCSNDLPIVKRLLSIPGIDPNICDKNGRTPLLSAINDTLNLDIINALLDFYGENIQSQMWQLNEGIKIIFKHLSKIDNSSYMYNNYQKKIVKDDQKTKIFNVIERLLQVKNLDLNYPIGKLTLFTYACEINEITLVKILIKSENINVNSREFENGNTPLMFAINSMNSEIAEFLIELPETDINLRNFNQQTALTIAVGRELEKIVSLLLNNERFDHQKSRLDYAFFISSKRMVNQLISAKNLDVNYKLDKMLKSYQKIENDSIGYDYCVSKYQKYTQSKETHSFETTLQNAVSKNNIEKVQMIITHPTFDPIKSFLKESIFIAAKKNEGEIFKKLIKLINNNVNICEYNGNSLLVSSAMSESQEIVTRIVENPKFDPVESDLYKAFMKASLIDEDCIIDKTSESKIGIMNILCKYDEEHDHLIDFKSLLPNGKSFFTSIDHQIKNIGNLVLFFIDHGVDVNAPDERGIYPLEYAIGINSFEFVSTLICSSKVDYSIKFKDNQFSLSKNDQTYLHIAARCNNEKILSELIGLKLFDINSTDENGETPLMEACKYNRACNIRILFKMEELDYLYCNNYGEDAIKVAQKCSNLFDFRKNKYHEAIETKDEYLVELLSIIDDNLNNSYR